MPRKREINQEMRQASQKKIVATATKLFVESGYYSVKMKDIATHADISVGRIYWYFDNKEAILKTILEEGFTFQKRMLREIQALQGSREEKLRRLIEKYLQLSRNNTEFIQILLSVMAGGSTDLVSALGFDTRQIGMEYHMILHKILSTEEDMNEATAHGLSTLFFSIFFGMIIIYGPDWHKIPDQFFIERIMCLLIGKI